jgi:hypothetical protein
MQKKDNQNNILELINYKSNIVNYDHNKYILTNQKPINYIQDVKNSKMSDEHNSSMLLDVDHIV